MMKNNLFFSSLLLAALTVGSAGAQTEPVKAVAFHSSNGHYWQMRTEPVINQSVGKAQVVIRSNEPQQTFKGWGTCFNELDYDAWQRLSETDRTLFHKRVFNPDGDLRLTVGRIPVGASDYANNWYSCDETESNGTNSDGTTNFATDFEMEHFTIERDRLKVIPSIKEALKENPDMTFWASPWSPPQWMKKNKHYAQRVTDTNGCPWGVPPGNTSPDNDQFIDDPAYYNAYCLYFDKFIEAYKNEGINIAALAYQNEAYSNTPYPGCSWSGAATGKFLGQYLGPYMAEHRPDLTLIVGTMNTGNYDFYNTILNSEGVSRYCKQVGFQWEGRNQIANVRRNFPDFELVQTESECGSGTFDWPAAAHTFELCNHYLSNGVTTYTYWNAILTDNGQSHWGWVQNALVQVSSATNTARYCAEYYAYKHYTHLIPAGSKILTCDPANLLTSALTPDGNVVIVAGNESSSEKSLSVDVDGSTLVCTLAPKSMASYVVGTETNLAKMLLSEARGLVNVESASLSEAQKTALNNAITDNSYNQLLDAVASAEQSGRLLNGSFTEGDNHWTLNNVAASGDFKAETVLGKQCYNNWSNNFTSLDLYQNISGLPEGLYTVSALSVCGEGNITDQHVYAETATHLVKSPVKTDDVWSSEHWEEQTTETIYVGSDGCLRVGYASASGGGTKGWFCVTGFELTRVGDLTDDFDLTANRKDNGLEAARTAYRAAAEEARSLTTAAQYAASARLALTSMLTRHDALLETLTEAVLVLNLERELREQMSLVLASVETALFSAQAVGAGSFLLYDVTEGRFLNYNQSSPNFLQLSATPALLSLTSNGEGTYALRMYGTNYLKIGYWSGGDRRLWDDSADAGNTKWVFTPTSDGNYTYIISTSEYADANVSGTRYLSGSDVSADETSAHEYILVNPADYVNLTEDATPMISWSTVGNGVNTAKSSGFWPLWQRGSSNQAGGYAENPAAINSEAHSGYGVSYWRGSAAQNEDIIYQDVSGLPAGDYTLSAYAAATVWNNNNGNDNRSGCHLFANESTTAVTTPKYALYDVDFTLSEGQNLRVGLRVDEYNGNNWCFLSDMTLTYRGTDRTEAFIGVNPEVQYATFCAPFAMSLPSDVKAYSCSETEGNALLLNKVESPVPANTPVILFAPEGYPNTSFKGNREGSETLVSSGLLTGNVSDAVQDIPYIGREYLLQRQEGVTAFYKLDGEGYKVGINRCYLQLPAEGSARPALYFNKNDDPMTVTALPSAATSPALSDGTYLIDGRIVVVKGGVRYALSGQILK